MVRIRGSPVKDSVSTLRGWVADGKWSLVGPDTGFSLSRVSLFRIVVGGLLASAVANVSCARMQPFLLGTV